MDQTGKTPFGGKNALTQAIHFNKAIGAPTRSQYPPRTQSADAPAVGHHGTLAFHSSKVPNLGNVKTGDAITARVHGSVHSVDPNGNMTMHVSDIKPDSTEMEKKQQHPEQKVPERGIETGVKTREKGVVSI